MGRSIAVAILIAFCASACSETTRTARAGGTGGGSGGDWWRPNAAPDELPEMLNTELPFRYPLAEYARRVEGEVILRLHVDTLGNVVSDSTRVSVSSGIPALDAAALSGASQLRFRPAKRRGEAIAVSLLYPVQFRRPDAQRTAPTQTDSLVHFQS